MQIGEIKPRIVSRILVVFFFIFSINKCLLFCIRGQVLEFIVCFISAMPYFLNTPLSTIDALEPRVHSCVLEI